jgi:glycosyltransferase involved in cell wall biosynthesis
VKHRKVLHIFNSSSVAGPEALVIPSLSKLPYRTSVVNLGEVRLGDKQHALEAYCNEHGVPHHLVEVRSRVDSTAITSLASLFENQKPCVLHAHDVKASAYTLLAVRKLSFKPRLVSTHHGVIGRPDLRSKIYEWIYSKFILTSFHLTTVVSNFDKQHLTRRGIDPGKLSIIPNGVDRPYIATESRPQIRSKVHQLWNVEAEDTVVCGVVARLSCEKNHQYLLLCLKALVERELSIPWKVLCFGAGDCARDLDELTDKLGLQEYVKWMGYRATVGDEFAGFDLLLSFSKGEGMPISFLEAGWSGTPIFSSAVGGVPEVISDKETGFLFNLEQPISQIAEQLAHVIQSPGELRRVGTAFQRHVRESFSGENWRKQLVQCYESA